MQDTGNHFVSESEPIDPLQKFSRRYFLGAAGATCAGLALSSNVFAANPKSTGGGLVYTFVNKTNGGFKDEQIFWSLDGGKEWHSIAKEPTAPCPNGNGRLYFYMGKPPRNFDDHEAYWDFIEWAYHQGGAWNGNTTQVDAFCLPITIEMGNKKVGIMEPRNKLFEAFSKECPAEFKDCVKGDYWIVSPKMAGFQKGGPHGDYFDKYVDQVWAMYADEQKTPSGKWSGKVTGTALTFTPLAGGGKPQTCPRKPTTQEILLGEGILASSPSFCAAFNRHVAADPGDWRDASKFYQAEPCNWYSKFMHEHAINHKAYGFCYDDYAEQAAFFSAKGDNLIVTFYGNDSPESNSSSKSGASSNYGSGGK